MPSADTVAAPGPSEAVTSAQGTSRLGDVESPAEVGEVRSSPLALAVLSLLHAAPLHPYAIQRLLKLWGKDHVINVGQRANLYKTIRRLDQAGLIAVRQTVRDQQYPERTVYEVTQAGRAASKAWLTEMLARPRNEFPQFPAALSFLMLLTPAEARVVLEERAVHLRSELAAVEADLANAPPVLPRIVLMDDDYRRRCSALNSTGSRTSPAIWAAARGPGAMRSSTGIMDGTLPPGTELMTAPADQ